MIQPVNSVQLDRRLPVNQSKFRNWVNEIWLENREERLLFKEDPITIKQYWGRYKYWLKREYRHQNEKRT